MTIYLGISHAKQRVLLHMILMYVSNTYDKCILQFITNLDGNLEPVEV